MLGSRSVDLYERLSHIDEGTYGIVWKARCKSTNSLHALKQLKFGSSNLSEGFPLAALREVSVLMSLSHPNIVTVSEMVVGAKATSIFMVMEYMECDLKKAVSSLTEVLTQGEVKSVMRQLCSALSYMHGRYLFHRDLKTANILVHRSGKVSICDFGLARKYDSPLRNDYTQLVITLWYRPPELLLGAKTYGPGVDVWSWGCVFAELLNQSVLFEGQGEVDQLAKIFAMLGQPSDDNWVNFSKLPHANTFKFKGGDTGFDLLSGMLKCDPSKRITAKAAEEHSYFKVSPFPREVQWNWEGGAAK